MSFRVSPNESTVRGDHEMTSRSISEQPGTMNEFASADSLPPEQENINEHLLKGMDEVYSPVLKLMKLFGIYYGDTTLKSLTNQPGSCLKNNYFSLTYCVVVVTGLWFNFLLALLGCFFFPERIYIFLMFSAWCLIVALNATIFLTVSPLTATRKSRFDNFLRCVATIKPQVSLQKVKTMSRYGMTVFFFVCTICNVGALTTALKLDMNLASFEPFNQSSVTPVLSVIFLMLGTGAWLLPILHFYITCLLIVELFDDLRKRMSKESLRAAAMELAALKKEHHKLCEALELADEMFSHLLGGMVGVFIPLICFNSYLAVNVPREAGGERVLFVANNTFWLVLGACELAVIMLFGSKVSEKVHRQSFCKTRTF